MGLVPPPTPPLPPVPGKNFADDPTVKIPWVRRDLSGSKMITMEWIDGVRCTDPQAIFDSGLDVDRFISVGVVSGLRQLLEFGLFHGDPHPGNLFAMRDGRIAYVDFGNVAEISQVCVVVRGRGCGGRISLGPSPQHSPLCPRFCRAPHPDLLPSPSSSCPPIPTRHAQPSREGAPGPE